MFNLQSLLQRLNAIRGILQGRALGVPHLTSKIESWLYVPPVLVRVPIGHFQPISQFEMGRWRLLQNLPVLLLFADYIIHVYVGGHFRTLECVGPLLARCMT